MCLSFFQIQDLGQSRSKSAFSFLFPSVLLSCQHYLKAIFRIILPSHFFCLFEWCGTEEPLLLVYLWEMWRKTRKFDFQHKNWKFPGQLKLATQTVLHQKGKDKSSASSQGRYLESFSRKILFFTPVNFIAD